MPPRSDLKQIAAACKEYKIFLSERSSSCLPIIERCQVVLGVPPIGILSSRINGKFFIKVELAIDLHTAAHDSSVLRQKYVVNLLENQLRKFVKLGNNYNRFFTVYNIYDFIELMWRRKWTFSDNNLFFKCYTETTSTYNNFTPF